MNTIPLVKGNTQEEINTSLIALKKALDEMNSSSSKTDASVQSQIKQINELITNINSHLDTIDGQITDLQPVDSVTSGNMQSVTSNAVANELTLCLKTYEQPWGTPHSYQLVPNSTYILFCQSPNVFATDMWLIKSRHSTIASLTGYCQIIMKGTYSPDYNIGITGDTLTIDRECVTSLIKINLVHG